MIEDASTAEALGGRGPFPWPRVAIGDVARTSSGTTPSRRRAERYFAGGTVPWVKTLDLRNGEISATDECVTDLAVQETSLQVYPPGTVLVAMYGGFNQIGRTGLLRIPACVNQALSAIQVNRNRVVPEYLLAALNFRVEHWKAVASSSRKDPNITGNDVRAFELPLPSMEEQRSIVAVLSDVDALLAKLDQLIAKKRDLKQAAMQQLLSGEIRLPGFASQCRTVQLADLGAWVGGATPSMKNAAYWTDGDVPWISSGDVTQPLSISALRLITRRAVLETATKVLPAGSLVLVTRSGILRHTLPIALVPSPVSINQDIKGLIPKTGVFGPFVLQALLESAPRILGACLKAGTTVESIEFRWLKRFPIRLPEVSEQRAIAEVLSDMDTELVALEARRDKTRQLKQGMMQALLTGRIRLT